MTKIGIVLSGGGARGIAHLGVLQALTELKIEPEIISGVSAGAIMGAFYSAGYQPKEILNIVQTNNFFGLTKLLWRKSGLLSMNNFSNVYKKYFAEDTFESLNKLLFITATDILTAESVCFSTGPLSPVIIASSSVPVVFEPYLFNGYTLLDGGLLNNFPIEPLSGKCDKIIGVNVNPIDVNLKEIHFRDVLDRSFHLALSTSVRMKSHQCDLFIEPTLLCTYGMFDINKSGAIFQIGYDHTMSMKDKILAIQ